MSHFSALVQGNDIVFDWKKSSIKTFAEKKPHNYQKFPGILSPVNYLKGKCKLCIISTSYNHLPTDRLR